MRILNYNGCTFGLIEEENFFVAYFNYIDYNGDIREVCITRQYVGRSCLYVARYSGFTTEYTGNLKEVLDKVILKYNSENINNK